MAESVKQKDKASPKKKLHLLSKEMEEAANRFLSKLDQLEKMLREVNE